MIIIPDVHGRTFWKSAVEGRENEEIIFLGDYVDPYSMIEDVAPYEGAVALREVIQFKKQHMKNVTLLIGNHDLSYISNYFPKCRYDYDNAEYIKQTILDNLSLFKIAHQKRIKGKLYIFSHAGILPIWLEGNEMVLGHCEPEQIVERLNKVFTEGHLYEALGDVSTYRGGGNQAGSCVWADVMEHYTYWYRHPEEALSNVFQVFGHTQLQDGPILTPEFACLDCRRAFLLNKSGKLRELNGKN